MLTPLIGWGLLAATLHNIHRGSVAADSQVNLGLGRDREADTGRARTTLGGSALSRFNSPHPRIAFEVE